MSLLHCSLSLSWPDLCPFSHFLLPNTCIPLCTSHLSSYTFRVSVITIEYILTYEDLELGTMDMGEHEAFVFWDLGCLMQYNFFFIFIHLSTDFIFTNIWIVLHSVYGPLCHYSLTSWRTFIDCFNFLAIVNRPAIKMDEQVSVGEHVKSFGNVLRGGIAVS